MSSISSLPLDRRSISQFEDLSNELIYEIFDYLDYFFIDRIFYSLNQRFRSVIEHRSFTLKISLPLMKKSELEHRCQTILLPHRWKIISLNILDYSRMNLSIDQFTSLENLSLNDISSDQFGSIVKQLKHFARLKSLSLHSTAYFPDENTVLQSILHLKSLKFCRLSFVSGGYRLPLPFAPSHATRSNLQRLIINGHCRLEQLISIFTYTPELEHFSCSELVGLEGDTSSMPSLSLRLKTLRLRLNRVPFDELKTFFMKIGAKLEVLAIREFHDQTFFHASSWQSLIEQSMPCLKQFDFQYTALLLNNSHTIEKALREFSSNFWIDRRWFFDYEYFRMGITSCLKFYSRLPQR